MAPCCVPKDETVAVLAGRVGEHVAYRADVLRKHTQASGRDHPENGEGGPSRVKDNAQNLETAHNQARPRSVDLLEVSDSNGEDRKDAEVFEGEHGDTEKEKHPLELLVWRD
eukprot:3690144-Rhodomonas_salina.1